MLAAVFKDNADVNTLRTVNTSNGNDLCQASQDYEQCRNRQIAEQTGARSVSMR